MFLMGWVVLAITSKMYSTCWLVSLSSRSRMAFVVCACLPIYWVLSGQQYISTMLSSSSCSISGAYRLARMSISSFSRNSARTRVAIWSKSSVSAVCPDRLVLCLLVFCLLVGQQALCLQRQLLILKMVVAHDGVVDVFVDAECGHGGFPFSPVCGQTKTQRPRLSGNAAFRQRSLR